jgi:hypothetical protein
MARMNPKRRLIAKLKAWERQAHELTVAYNNDATVTNAPVKSSLQPRVTLTHYAKPREAWEGTGLARRKLPKRFSVK